MFTKEVYYLGSDPYTYSHYAFLEPPIRWQADEDHLIGRGAVGKVYQGFNVISGTFVAIKRIELPPEMKLSADQKREIKLLQQLRHGHVIRYIGMLSSSRQV